MSRLSPYTGGVGLLLFEEICLQVHVGKLVDRLTVSHQTELCSWLLLTRRVLKTHGIRILIANEGGGSLDLVKRNRALGCGTD